MAYFYCDFRDTSKQNLVDFRSPSRAGGACVLPHHTWLNQDCLSVTLNFWNPPSLSRVLLFVIEILYLCLCLVTSRSCFCFMLISASYHLRNRSRLLFWQHPKSLTKLNVSLYKTQVWVSQSFWHMHAILYKDSCLSIVLYVSSYSYCWWG
jgi:hypothetical protein